MKQTGAIIFLLLACAGTLAASATDLASRLAARQARVRFDQADLSDALAIVGESVHGNVIADWGALQSVGIRQDTHVSMQFENVSAATTLDVICRLIGGGTSWFLQDGVVRLTTRDELDKLGTVRAYWPNGIGGIPSERAAKAANILREYVSGLGESAIRLSGGQLIVRGTDDTQERAAHVLELCSRPMTPTEWRQMLGVEKDLNDSRELISVSWQAMGIGQCLSDLSTKAKIPMLLDGQSDPAQTITLEMKNATPSQVMEGLLGAAGSMSGSKRDEWTCESTARGAVLWVGPMSRARSWCASYLLGPAAMRDLRVNSPMDGPAAICAAVGGCDGDHVRWVGGQRILCLQKMEQILAIGKILADPAFESAMRPNKSDSSAAASSAR